MSDNEKKKPKLLLADDSKVIRTSASKILGAEFELLLAVDGQDAWEQLQADRDICVLFTDLGMPFIDGMQLMAKVRGSDDEALAQLPVVILTGDETDEAREDALAKGASDFITKPFNKVDLLARARSHATAQQEKRELEAHSTVDRLTRLATEHHFLEKLQEMRSFTLRHDHAMSLLKIEVDSIKDTVKGFGKESFLKRMRDLGSLIKVCVRKEDTAARIDAVKFGVLLPTCDSDGALALAKRIQATLEAAAKRSNWGVPLSLSIGVSTPSLDPDMSVDDIIADLDKAVGAALRTGPGGVELSPMTRKKLEKGGGHGMTVASALKYLANGDEAPVKAQLEGLLDSIAPLLKLARREAREALKKILT